jgi:hypothetical protein
LGLDDFLAGVAELVLLFGETIQHAATTERRSRAELFGIGSAGGALRGSLRLCWRGQGCEQ